MIVERMLCIWCTMMQEKLLLELPSITLLMEVIISLICLSPFHLSPLSIPFLFLPLLFFPLLFSVSPPCLLSISPLVSPPPYLIVTGNPQYLFVTFKNGECTSNPYYFKGVYGISAVTYDSISSTFFMGIVDGESYPYFFTSNIITNKVFSFFRFVSSSCSNSCLCRPLLLK